MSDTNIRLVEASVPRFLCARPAPFRGTRPVSVLSLAATLSLAAPLALSPSPAHAQSTTSTWTGGGANSNWSVGGNWSNGSPNSATTLARFLTGASTASPVLEGDYSVYGLSFDQSYVGTSPVVTRFTITGAGSDWSINLYGGGITNNTALTQTIDGVLTLRTSQSFTTVAGGTLSLTSGQYNQLNLQGNTLTIGGAGDTLIASKIIADNSSGKIIKSGTGTLSLTGSNTYTGMTTITGGTLLINSTGALGTQGISGLNLSNGTNGGVFGYTSGTNTVSRNFTLSGTGSGFTAVGSNDRLSVSGTLSGGKLTIGSAGSLGTVQLTGSANTYTGGTTIAGGTLLVSSAAALGTGAVSLSNGTSGGLFGFTSGTNTIGSNFTLSGSGGGFVAANTADILTVSGVVSGSGTLSIGGNGSLGTVVLSGTNTYSGGTVINGGTLQIAKSNTLGTGEIVNNSKLLLSPTGGNATLTVGSVISGTGSVTVTGGSTDLGKPDTVFLTALNTYTGGTTVGANGYLRVGATAGNVAGSLGTGTINVNDDGNLFFQGSSSAGSNTVNVNQGSTFNFLDNSTADSATITNDSYLAFHHNASMGSADITIQSVGYVNGRLHIPNVSVFDIATAGNANITNNATLNFTNTSTAGNATITNNNASTAPGFTFNQSATAGNATIINNGILSFNDTSSAGSAKITINNGGKVNFTNAATGDNASIIVNSGGTLNVANPRVSLSIGQVSGAGTITLGGRTLSVGGKNTSDTFSGVIADGDNLGLGGSFVKVGSGTLTLSNNASSFTGNLSVAGGTLIVSGSNTSAATPTYSTFGDLTVLNPFTNSVRTVTVGSGATLQFAANDVLGNTGASPSLSFVVNANGTITNNGSTFNVLGPVTLNGGTLTATGGANSNYLSYAFRGNVTVGGSTASTISSSGTYGGYHLNSSTTFDVANVTGNSATDLTVSGLLTNRSGGAGQGSLTKAGAGTMTLTNTNTYSGGTTITGGVLSIGADSNVGTGSVTLNGGSLRWTGGSETFGRTVSLGSASGSLDVATAATNLTVASILTGSGSLTKAGTGTLTLTGASTYTGGTTITGGALAISADSNVGTGSMTLNGGSLRWAGGSETFGRTLVLGNGSSSIDVTTTSTNLAVASNLTGTGSLTKTGSGALIVTGMNTYTGGTTISGGTLQLGDGATSNGSITGNVVNNASLVFANPSDQTYSGVMSGTGSLAKSGAGALTLTGASTYSGGTTINAGSVAVSGNTALGTGALTLAAGTTLSAASATTLSNAVTLGGTANLNSGTFTTANVHSPGLGLAGAVTLSSDTATTTLNVTGTSRVGIAGVVSEANGQSTALVKRGMGTLELDNDNTYTGGTLVSQGTLVVNNAYQRTALGSGTGQGAVTIASGATLTGTYVIGGPVQVNGGGRLAVGNSIGNSTVSFLNLSGGSVLDFEIGADGMTSDHLDITSLLSRNGMGGVTFAFSGEHLADGSINALSAGTFTLLTFGGENGFSANDFQASGLPDGWNYAFALSGGNGRSGALTVTLSGGTAAAAPEPSALQLFTFGPLGAIAGAALLRRGKKSAK